MKIDLKKNHIVCGDNVDWLRDVPDESVDLCYIDPPFFSNRDYEVLWGNGYELRSFGDRFAGGVSHYIEWMRPRIELIHRKLKRTGSIFLHCDWHATHRLRCALDDIFGESNFRSEIVWQRTHGSKGDNKNARGFSNNTDSILYYTKSNEFYFKAIFLPYSEEYTKKKYRNKDAKGWYSCENLRNPGYRPNLIYNYKGYKPHPNGWAITKEKMEDLDKKGLIHFPKDKDGRLAKKNYLKDMPGVRVANLWNDIPYIQPHSQERLGYPTQKPEALLKRIIECASEKGDLILDCFAGGGTTAKVAADLERHFIVGDVSPVAVKIMSERLYFDCPDAKFEIKNLPQTESELKNMNGHEFADVVCEVMGWEANERKSGDGGVDAWAGEGHPVQIKNHSKASAGRPDMQKFFGALAKEKSKKGIFVAWDFSGDALDFIADMKREHKVEIVAMKCHEVFGGLLLDRARGQEIHKLYSERRPKNWKQIEASSSKQKSAIEKAEKGRSKTSKGRLKQSAREQ